jgi:hypothetical protein
MARIVLMSDPSGITGREVIDAPNGALPCDLIPEAVRFFDPENTTAFRNGLKVEFPSFDLDGNVLSLGTEDLMTDPLQEHDVLVIIMEPKGFTMLAYLLVSIAASAIVAFLMMPSVPGQQTAKTSSNNSLYGQTNSVRIYQAIPDIYGKIVSYPDLVTSEASRLYVNNKTNLRQIMVVGAGEYDIPTTGNSIRLGDTPVSQMPGSSVQVINPVSGDAIIADYEVHNSVSQVEGQELRGTEGATVGIANATIDYDDLTDVATITATGDLSSVFDPAENIILEVIQGGLTKINSLHVISTVTTNVATIDNASTFDSFWTSGASFPFTAENGSRMRAGGVKQYVGPFDTGVAGDALIVDIAYVRGLVGEALDGFLVKTVVIEVKYIEIDAPGGTEIGVEQTITANHTPESPETFDRQNRSIFIDIDGVGGEKKFYRVKVARTTDASDKTDEPDMAKWERLASVSRSTNKSFGNITMLDVNIPETSGALSPRKNKVNLDVTRKTVSYDTNTGTVINVISPSKRFADAILHEYTVVFSRNAQELDLDELYAIQEELDLVDEAQTGEFSFSFDDLDVSLGERMETICNAARVRTYMDGGLWRFTREQVQLIPNGMITRKDIASERSYSRTWRPRIPSQHNGVRLEFVDPETNKRAYANRTFNEFGTVIIGASSNPMEIQLGGCRNRFQAEDRANMEVRRLIHDNWILTDTLLSQGNLYDLGDLVQYADIYREDILDGEIITADLINNILTLSEKFDYDITYSYEISFTDEFGEVYGPYPIQGAPSENQVSVIGDFDTEKSRIITRAGIHRQLGSRFIINKVDDGEAELFTVSEKDPQGNGLVQVTLTQYDERIFERGPFSQPEAREWVAVARYASLPFSTSADYLSSFVSDDGETMSIFRDDGYVSSSADGGDNFAQAGPQYFNNTLFEGDKLLDGCMAIDNSLIMYALMSSGDNAIRDVSVCATTDGGTTWVEKSQIILPIVVNNTSQGKIRCSANGVNVVFFTYGGGGFISNDSGATWAATPQLQILTNPMDPEVEYTEENPYEPIYENASVNEVRSLNVSDIFNTMVVAYAGPGGGSSFSFVSSNAGNSFSKPIENLGLDNYLAYIDYVTRDGVSFVAIAGLNVVGSKDSVAVRDANENNGWRIEVSTTNVMHARATSTGKTFDAGEIIAAGQFYGTLDGSASIRPRKNKPYVLQPDGLNSGAENEFGSTPIQSLGTNENYYIAGFSRGYIAIYRGVEIV